MTAREFWDAFLKDNGRDPSTEWYECFGFGPTPRVQDELLALVLEGKKRATTSCVASYVAEGQRLARPGDLSVVLDGSGNPRCVIETERVMVLPFRDVTFETCSREGEDEALDTWREAHFRIFSDEGRELGFAFTEDSPVAFEDFRVVYPPETQ
ncbi:MAG: ASCH domain-containing protein [Clostridiales bacterium]|nr:ASCH domain-containing protein [Clostridiales bacterium]